jgi:pimeloyl-[acyl-carrier protein] methyl ester esterase
MAQREMTGDGATLPSLCFIGGWGSTEAVWERTLERVEGNAPTFLSWLECIEDWPAALGKLRSLPRCVLVGWSLGGLLALRAALELGPENTEEKIAGLVLVSATSRMCASSGSGGDYVGADGRALAAMRNQLARAPEVVLAEFAAACAAPDGGEEVRAGWLRQAKQFSAEEMTAGLACLATCDLRERLGEVAVPCRILHGEGDRIVPLGSAQFLAGRIVGAELEVVRGRGHALPFTAPAEIARCIAEVTKTSVLR